MNKIINVVQTFLNIEVDGAPAMNIEAEGATLLSTTRVNRTFVFQQLRQTVEQLRGVGAIR